MEGQDGSENHPTQPFNSIHTIEAAHQIKRRGVEAKLVLADHSISTPQPDQTLIKLIANAHHWLAQLTNGSASSIAELAKQQQIDPADISRFLPLAFLAPDVVESILAGSQPIDLTTDRLCRMNSRPIFWNDQRVTLGFAAQAKRRLQKPKMDMAFHWMSNSDPSKSKSINVQSTNSRHLYSNLQSKHLVTENGLGRLLLNSARISPNSHSLDQTMALYTALSPRYYGDIQTAY